MIKIISRFLDVNQRELNRLSKIVEKINSKESDFRKFKKEDFRFLNDHIFKY